MPKVGFVSLGCPKNLVDSEVMLGLLRREGFDITPQPDQADIVVVNTCGFIGTAQQESVDTILEAARWKDEGKCKKLIVAGCLVERFKDSIRFFGEDLYNGAGRKRNANYLWIRAELGKLSFKEGGISFGVTRY